MKSRILRWRSQLFLVISLILCAGSLSFAAAQEKPKSKPINLDRELEVKLPQNRALSYYHYSLAKWHEENGDTTAALSEMRRAVKYNESSSAAHVGLASLLLDKVGDAQEAMSEATEAARLDPSDPEPHWILANICFKSQDLEKAAKELEAMRDAAPQDERAYFALGTAYLELGQTDKGIKAFERFQTLVPNTNQGYMEIARFYQRKAEHEQGADQTNYLEKSLEFLKKAVEIDPDSVQTLLSLAELQTKLNKTQELVETYKKVLDLTGDNPNIKKQLASAMIDSGQFSEALKVLDQLQKALPDDKDLQVLLGRARVGNQQYPEAIEALKSAVKADPDSVEAQFYLGAAYQQSGDSKSAATIFSELVNRSKDSEELKSNRPIFQQRLAAAYTDAGETDKAVAVYEQMVEEQNPPNPQTVFLLINAYRVNRQFDKALALGKNEYEKNPAKAKDIGLVYARTLADAGKSKEGAEILNKMLQSDPLNADIYVNLSQVYLQGKKFADAEKVLRQAQDKNLDNPDREKVKFQLASVYERSKEFDRAESIFKELLKDNPKNAMVLNYMGYMLADRGVRLQEALQYVKEALAVEPNNPAYLDSLGWAFYKLNDFSNAEKYLLQAVEMTKNDPTMYDHLGDLYYKTGDVQKALDFWSRSVQNANPTEPEETQKVRDKLEKLQDTLHKKHRP